jgi:tetratricopeptide (TPR) repeat protein
MIDPLLEQGLAASQANDSVRALDLFAQASAAAPTAGLPHFLMASEWASLGEIEKAEAAFANAVLLAPDLTIAHYQLGLLQFSSGRAALALVIWQPLLQLVVHHSKFLGYKYFSLIRAFSVRNCQSMPVCRWLRAVLHCAANSATRSIRARY